MSGAPDLCRGGGQVSRARARLAVRHQGCAATRCRDPWYRFNDPLFKQLDVVGTHSPLLLVKVPEFTPWSDDAAWPAGCTLFVPFQDPENVGSVIRSAAAFGVAQVVLLREAAHPFHPRSSRAAGPALFQVPILTGPRWRRFEWRPSR